MFSHYYSISFLCSVFKVHFSSQGFPCLVGSSGLEPPTSRLSGVRSNHLSYEPILLVRGFASLAFGGDERDRTDDPLLAKQVLSQLSYTPMLLSCVLQHTLKIKQRVESFLENLTLDFRMNSRFIHLSIERR